MLDMTVRQFLTGPHGAFFVLLGEVILYAFCRLAYRRGEDDGYLHCDYERTYGRRYPR